MLTKDAILAKTALEFRDVLIPEWGESVRVQALSGKERDSYNSSLRQQRGNEMKFVGDDLTAKLVVRALVDENGKRIFTDQDTNAVSQLDSRALQRIYDVAAELSGLTAESVADAEGNSDTTPSDGSTSA